MNIELCFCNTFLLPAVYGLGPSAFPQVLLVGFGAQRHHGTKRPVRSVYSSLVELGTFICSYLPFSPPFRPSRETRCLLKHMKLPVIPQLLEVSVKQPQSCKTLSILCLKQEMINVTFQGHISVLTSNDIYMDEVLQALQSGKSIFSSRQKCKEL